jgi:hypothetical protein
MDCSGFSKYMYFRLFGLELPHKASMQYRLGIFRDTSREPLRKGDLVFFKKRNTIDHVGIYLEDGKFVHSIGRKGVVISSLENPYWKSILAGSRRLMGLENDTRDDVTLARALADVPFDERSSFRLHVSLLLHDEQPFSGVEDPFPWTSDPGSPSDRWWDAPYSIEIGYQRDLAMDFVNLQMSAFWERSLFEPGLTLFPSSLKGGTSHTGNPEDPRTFLQGGLSLAGEIGLFDGFRIRPSLTLIERGTALEENWGDTRSVLGLEALLAPPLAAYDLSMAVDYADRLESALQPLDLAGNTNEWGMSLRFRYKLTDLMRISFAGQHAFGDPSKSLGGSRVRGRSSSDFLFLFDLSY